MEKIDLLKCLECAYCGLLFDVTEVNIEHIVPVSKGGNDSCHNKTQTCKECNFEKADLQLPIYAQICKLRKGSKIKIANINRAIQYVVNNGLLCFKNEQAYLQFKNNIMAIKNMKFAPWKTGKQDYSKAIVYDSSNKMIADCNIQIHSAEKCEANANLIAYAPAMFYQLQQVVTLCEEDSEVIQHCKDLLEKMLTGKYTAK